MKIQNSIQCGINKVATKNEDDIRGIKEIELLRKKDPPEELFEWHEITKRN